MSNLQLFDPHFAQQLEYREQKQNNKYYLWTFSPCAADFHITDTIEEARALWSTAKTSRQWKSWELSKGRELIKKGEF